MSKEEKWHSWREVLTQRYRRVPTVIVPRTALITRQKHFTIHYLHTIGDLQLHYEKKIARRSAVWRGSRSTEVCLARHRGYKKCCTTFHLSGHYIYFPVIMWDAAFRSQNKCSRNNECCCAWSRWSGAAEHQQQGIETRSDCGVCFPHTVPITFHIMSTGTLQPRLAA